MTLRAALKAHVKSCAFRGKDYTMAWRKPRRTKASAMKGLCSMAHCNYDTSTIVIDPAYPPKTLLANTMHEALHACMPDLDESAVGETSNAIMDCLCNMGIEVTFAPERSQAAKREGWLVCDPYYNRG